MDIAVHMRHSDVLGQNVAGDEILGAFRAVFEHRAHRRIGVDIGIFALDIGIFGAGKSQFIVNIHQIDSGLAQLRMLSAVEDIRLGRAGEIAGNQCLFHDILNLFHAGELRFAQ